MSDHIVKLAEIADGLDRNGQLKHAGYLDLAISTVVGARRVLASFGPGDAGCWGDCYRSKRLADPSRSAREVWAACVAEAPKTASVGAALAAAVHSRVAAGEHPGHAVLSEIELRTLTPVAAIAASADLVRSVADEQPDARLKAALAGAADALAKEAQSWAENLGGTLGGGIGGLAGAMTGAGFGGGVGAVPGAFVGWNAGSAFGKSVGRGLNRMFGGGGRGNAGAPTDDAQLHGMIDQAAMAVASRNAAAFRKGADPAIVAKYRADLADVFAKLKDQASNMGSGVAVGMRGWLSNVANFEKLVEQAAQQANPAPDAEPEMPVEQWRRELDAQIESLAQRHAAALGPKPDPVDRSRLQGEVDSVFTSMRAKLDKINDPSAASFKAGFASPSVLMQYVERAAQRSNPAPASQPVDFGSWRQEVGKRIGELLAWNPKAGSPKKDATGAYDQSSYEFQQANYVFTELKRKLDSITDPAATPLKNAFTLDYFLGLIRKQAKSLAGAKSTGSGGRVTGRGSGGSSGTGAGGGLPALPNPAHVAPALAKMSPAQQAAYVAQLKSLIGTITGVPVP